ncbi:ATP-binding protein, partial [Fibrobacterota bacterium]
MIWLAGIRRIGKTSLCRSLSNTTYFDCELPRTRRRLEDPEQFLEDNRNKRIVLDEIHRLSNPSELLKIAADYYPDIKIIATGSSTLGASAKFKDTLAGRKETIWLTPILLEELEAFSSKSLRHRLLHGGFPGFFLSDRIAEKEFQDWMDSFWAKDLQELFRIERRSSFLKFTELLFAQSGSLFDATKFSKLCEISRVAVTSYLSILEATFIVHILKPYSKHKPTEIISRPKIYAMDTGFVCYYKGWDQIHDQEKGYLWEHIVLNQIQTHLEIRNMQYWRNKQGKEIDLVLASKKGEVHAVECKWKAAQFETDNVRSFRNLHPRGRNFVVATDITEPFKKKMHG